MLRSFRMVGREMWRWLAAWTVESRSILGKLGKCLEEAKS
uniref:Uncharacterized protein n=1 Tax=Pseudomonas aeruginosa TaxID=287 RepID=A0A2L1KH88_PSEAI|nr:Hypothetical protein [Pseudomonas aeruginosa]AVE22174.1 Hypothetical protein [Pseudomonas aeruginosa]